MPAREVEEYMFPNIYHPKFAITLPNRSKLLGGGMVNYGDVVLIR